MHFKKSFILIFVLAFSSLIFSPSTFAAASHIVISQVETNTASDDEFIELYNPTSISVDLSGFKLTRKNSSGTEANLVASLSGTIEPNHYFLIGSSSYSGSVTKDATYSNNSNNLTNNHAVLLYNSSSSLVDIVGMGSNLNFEGAAAPNPDALGSIQRKLDDTNGNGLDTDNNLSDFELLAASTPRNSSVVVVLPTQSPSPTPIATPTASPSATPTPTPTETPVGTETPTPSPSPTEMPAEVTPSPSPTATPTQTPVPTTKPRYDHKKEHDDDRDNDHHNGEYWTKKILRQRIKYASINNRWFDHRLHEVSCSRH